MQSNEFDWGEAVSVSPDAPKEYRPSSIADVVGMIFINTSQLAQNFNVKLNTWVYTIEYTDGSSIELPEMFLQKQ